MQLDESCRRFVGEAGIGGPVILLSVWMWEHFSVGRPKVLPWKPWNDHDHPKRLREATWAYKWDRVAEFTGDPQKEYLRYINEFDSLTPQQVIIRMLSFNHYLS